MISSNYLNATAILMGYFIKMQPRSESDETAVTIAGVPGLGAQGAEDTASPPHYSVLFPHWLYNRLHFESRSHQWEWKNIAGQNLIHYVILLKCGVRLQKIPIFPKISSKSQSDYNFLQYSNPIPQYREYHRLRNAAKINP